MKRLIVLLVAVCVSIPTLGSAGEMENSAGAAEAAAVKSGKSNSDSYRTGGPVAPAVEGTTVKSSKSNSSERGSVKGSKSNSSERGSVKGSKSNTSERGTSVNSGKSNSDN